MKKQIEKSDMEALPKIVAVDFDGTLVEDKYPAIGRANDTIVSVVKKLQAQGVEVILWSCRDGKNLNAAVQFCRDELGIEFAAVNQNHPAVQKLFSNDTRKVYADLYIDDKAIELSTLMEVLIHGRWKYYGS